MVWWYVVIGRDGWLLRRQLHVGQNLSRKFRTWYWYWFDWHPEIERVHIFLGVWTSWTNQLNSDIFDFPHCSIDYLILLFLILSVCPRPQIFVGRFADAGCAGPWVWCMPCSKVGLYSHIGGWSPIVSWGFPWCDGWPWIIYDGHGSKFKPQKTKRVDVLRQFRSSRNYALVSQGTTASKKEETLE